MYVLDIDVTRNGNNLKLKVKSEFSLISMGLMLINHSNPYIHSTITLGAHAPEGYGSCPVCVVSVRNLNLGTGASRGLNEGASE